MRLAMMQMAMKPERADNLARSLDAVREAADRGADLILFPELQLSRFFPQYPGQSMGAEAVTLEGEAVEAFRAVCRERRIMAVPNFYLFQGGDLFDASVVIGADGAVLGVQKMVHIAQAPQFYEQDYYTPADDGFQVFPTPFGNLGVVVCFDRHYPESIRTEALKGADLILVPTANTAAEPLELFEWEIRVQAFQNSVAVAMCNRVGTEDAMDFAGQSLVSGPGGELLVKADGAEGLVLCDLDPLESRKLRGQRPYTTLRVPRFYR